MENGKPINGAGSAKKSISGGGGRGVRDNWEDNPTVFIGPRECLGGSYTCQYWDKFEGLMKNVSGGMDVYNYTGNGVDLLVNVGRPAYRHLKGPISLGSPFVEGLVGGLFQVAKDGQNPYLSWGQIGVRGLTVGFENGVTDVVSEAAGYSAASWALGVGLVSGAIVYGGSAIATDGATIPAAPAIPVGAVGGALITKVAVSVVVNEGMNSTWDNINSYAFPYFGLGTYNP